MMSRSFRCFCWLVIAALPAVVGSAHFADAVASAYELGRFLPKNPKLAHTWYSKAAQQGDASAAYVMGLDYYVGRGVSANPSAAFSWWLRSAQMDNAEAQAAMGDAYCLGIGIDPDTHEARHWWGEARRNGNALAGDIERRKACADRTPLTRTSAIRDI